MKEIFDKLRNFFSQYPQYIYLIIGIVFLILFIGAIKDKKWAIDPESSRQRFFYNTFGHQAFRLIISVVYLLGTIAGFGMAIIYTY